MSQGKDVNLHLEEMQIHPGRGPSLCKTQKGHEREGNSGV